MDCEHKLKIVEQELASLREENGLLKEKLSALEHGSDNISFKEKYAVKILDTPHLAGNERFLVQRNSLGLLV